MRTILIFTFLIMQIFAIKGQTFPSYQCIRIGIPQIEFFTDSSNSYSAFVYKISDTNDTLSLEYGCVYTKQVNGIIRANLIDHLNIITRLKLFKHRYYWKIGDNNIIHEVRKNGELYNELDKMDLKKNQSISYIDRTTTISIIDSTINSIEWNINKKDTSCSILHKYVYNKKGQLIEDWYRYNYVVDGICSCNFNDSRKFLITKYYYPTKNITISKKIRPNDSIPSDSVINSKEIDIQNRVTSENIISVYKGNTYRIKNLYYYDNKNCIKIETLQGNKVTESIEVKY